MQPKTILIFLGIALVSLSACAFKNVNQTLIPSSPTIALDMGITTSTPAPTANAAFLSGGHIAFTQSVQISGDPSPHGSACHIFAMNTDGSNRADLTPTSHACEQAPAYSPNGKWIAYTKGFDLSDHQLYVMQADGANPQKITEHDFADADDPPVWFQDGQRLAVYEPREKQQPFFLLTRDGEEMGRAAELSPTEWHIPNDSPDGKFRAYKQPCAAKLPSPKLPCIYSTNADQIRIDQPLAAISGYYQDLAWSPSGDKIVFARGDTLYMMDANQTDVQTLGKGSGPAWQP